MVYLTAEMKYARSLVVTLKGNQHMLLIRHLDTVFLMNGSFQKFRLSSDKNM